MAVMLRKAVDSSNLRGSEMERIVNRWIFEYYLSLAIQTFRSDQYSDFCEIRDILDGVLSRPIDLIDSNSTKILVLQFLTRIHDGEKLDLTFDTDDSITPLESAMGVFEAITKECTVSQQDLERIHTSIREMLVVVCIKNKEFGKAKKMLAKHFPKSMVGKKAKFMDLVNKKKCKHEILEQVSFQQFKDEMVQFCESLYPASVPFLHQSAKQLVNERQSLERGENVELQLEKHDVPAASPVMQETSCKFKLSKCVVVQQKRLEAMYIVMAQEVGVPRTFAQLQEEVEQEVEENCCAPDPEPISLCLSISPIEGSDEEPGQQKEPPQRTPNGPIETTSNDNAPSVELISPEEVNPQMETAPLHKSSRVYTIARFVVEPDSQLSDQDSLASQEQIPETRLQDPVQLSHSQEDPLGPVSTLKTPTRQHRKRPASQITTNDVCILESSDDSCSEKGVHSAPQKSHTPQKSVVTKNKTSDNKWQQLVNAAKETKEQWSDEDSLFNSPNQTGPNLNSTKSLGRSKRKWNESETDWLRKGVAKYGEGQWEKIRTAFCFQGRTAVNIKDRWRTMKKLNLT